MTLREASGTKLFFASLAVRAAKLRDRGPFEVADWSEEPGSTEDYIGLL